MQQVHDLGNNIDTIMCKGIQHSFVRVYLSSADTRYATLRGTALSYWNYNSDQKTWHARECCQSIKESLQDGHQSCKACRRIHSKIRKENFPWLFDGIKVENRITGEDGTENRSILPSNNALIFYIQCIYRRTVCNNEPSNRNSCFMSNMELRKSLLILDTTITTIKLEGNCYLIRCCAENHITRTCNIVPFFFSTKLNVSLCRDCYQEQYNQRRKRLRQENNADNHIMAGSHCPIVTLSPHHLKM